MIEVGLVPHPCRSAPPSSPSGAARASDYGTPLARDAPRSLRCAPAGVGIRHPRACCRSRRGGPQAWPRRHRGQRAPGLRSEGPEPRPRLLARLGPWPSPFRRVLHACMHACIYACAHTHTCTHKRNRSLAPGAVSCLLVNPPCPVRMTHMLPPVAPARRTAVVRRPGVTGSRCMPRPNSECRRQRRWPWLCRVKAQTSSLSRPSRNESRLCLNTPLMCCPSVVLFPGMPRSALRSLAAGWCRASRTTRSRANDGPQSDLRNSHFPST